MASLSFDKRAAVRITERLSTLEVAWISMNKGKIVALVCILFLTCCGFPLGERHYFASEAESVRHLESNKSLFQQAVERWQAVNKAGAFEFHRWDSNSFSWNDTEIKPVKDRYYQVVKNREVLAEETDFDHAASLAGVSSEELRWWTNISQTLELYWISNIGTKLQPDQRYVEVSLRGSERGPYGFIYVPEDHASAYETFLYESERREPPLIYTKLDHIEGRWFYFESKP